MNNEDKVKQQIARNIAYNLGNKVCGDIKIYGYEDVYNAALQALQWNSKYYTSIPNAEYEELLYFKEQYFKLKENLPKWKKSRWKYDDLQIVYYEYPKRTLYANGYEIRIRDLVMNLPKEEEMKGEQQL